MNDSSDEELLGMFRLNGDEEAFAELMRRHGRTAMNAAFSVVGELSTAEDIVQATFLTLARKASELKEVRSIAGWLHHVALCLARNECRGKLRREAREKEASMMASQYDDTPDVSDAAIAALHEEISGLSETYRVAVILHHLEGRSYEDAAAALGCNAKAFSVRLARGREKLRKRLTVRGLRWGTAALVAALGQSASAAELPAGFVTSTCAAAKGGAVSAQVSALMESALKMLFWAKVKAVAAVCAVAVLVGGAGVGVAISLPLVLHQETTTAPRTEPLSPADVWIGELLARGDEGSWDIVDLGKCRAVGPDSVWMSDQRTGAERRFWSMGPVGEIMFDDARWHRGMVTARIMILPDGEGPSELDPPVGAEEVKTRISVDAIRERLQLVAGNSIQNGLRILPGRTGPGPYLSLGMYRPSVQNLLSAVEYAELLGPSAEKARWYRCVLYFDRKVGNGVAGLSSAWREDETCPSADAWKRFTVAGNRADPVGFGLHASGGRVLVQGLKFVPFGGDMPPPPWDPVER